MEGIFEAIFQILFEIVFELIGEILSDLPNFFSNLAEKIMFPHRFSFFDEIIKLDISN